jgi:hypothetical protein
VVWVAVRVVQVVVPVVWLAVCVVWIAVRAMKQELSLLVTLGPEDYWDRGEIRTWKVEVKMCGTLDSSSSETVRLRSHHLQTSQKLCRWYLPGGNR